jgi:hypothetical protein
MKNIIQLDSIIYLENIGGYYYKPFSKDGIEIKGLLLKDCTKIYKDGNTWEMIDIDSDGCIDVGPFRWDGLTTNEIGYNNFVYDYILKLYNS